MRELRKHTYEIFVIISTIFASLYIPSSQIVQEHFVRNTDPIDLIIFRFGFPILFGGYCGIDIKEYEKQNIKKYLFQLLMIIVNIGIIYVFWNTTYNISIYNLILCGILSAKFFTIFIKK